ncbi:MAG: hypothetical protein Q4C60_11720 [Eubacteriales bacterium]|nr:hypothetical protein [Eubacteriales bacterium]
MHIAICDDNVADRHQTERLLGRQAQSRKRDDDGIYIDSYGNIAAIMPFPQLYDIFFIDMVQSECDGLELARRLLSAGAHGYFVLCCSSIDYASLAREQNFESDRIRFLAKPILVAELTAVLDELVPLTQIREERIELRGLRQSDTLYVTPDEILWAQSDAHNTTVILTQGRKMMVAGEAYRLYLSVEENPLFSPINDHTFINLAHMKTISLFHISMEDGTKFRVSPYFTTAIKKQKKELEELGL